MPDKVLTALDLLMIAPEEQVTRARLAFKAIADGDWQNAEHYLRNAVRETETTNPEWAEKAKLLADFCAERK